METDTEKWADWLLCVWIGVVGVCFFGVAFWPALGNSMQKASVFYAVMVLVSAVTLALKFLRRASSGKK